MDGRRQHTRGVAGLLAAGVMITLLAVQPTDAFARTSQSIAAEVAAMTPFQRVGQLFMVPASSSGTSLPTAAITRYRFGSVLLVGNTGASPSAVHAVTARLQASAYPTKNSLLMATDQEGGAVQRLAPPGFARIPAALHQGQMASATLRADATAWGRQLKSAGVNLDLAPVLDTVPGDPSRNPPIGALKREYGATPSRVETGSLAFASGLRSAGVTMCGKHFPGLGLVHANTDFSSGVTDTGTGPRSPYLGPFRSAVQAGFRFVMVSSADYQLLDPHVPAVFSSKIVTGMLRGSMGFHGVVVSDSLNAKQVQYLSPGNRAYDFIRAGGDLIVTTDINTAVEMDRDLYRAELANPYFAKLIQASVTRILQAKAAMGLPA